MSHASNSCTVIKVTYYDLKSNEAALNVETRSNTDREMMMMMIHLTCTYVRYRWQSYRSTEVTVEVGNRTGRNHLLQARGMLLILIFLEATSSGRHQGFRSP